MDQEQIPENPETKCKPTSWKSCHIGTSKCFASEGRAVKKKKRVLSFYFAEFKFKVSFTLRRRQFENATITGCFGFVFEKNSGKEMRGFRIIRLVWRAFSWRISVEDRLNRRKKVAFSNFHGVARTGPKFSTNCRKAHKSQQMLLTYTDINWRKITRQRISAFTATNVEHIRLNHDFFRLCDWSIKTSRQVMAYELTIKLIWK